MCEPEVVRRSNYEEIYELFEYFYHLIDRGIGDRDKHLEMLERAKQALKEKP